MMLIYPNFIAPLFNKFEEINSGELFDSIKDLAIANKFPLPKIYSVDGSKVISCYLDYFLRDQCIQMHIFLASGKISELSYLIH